MSGTDIGYDWAFPVDGEWSQATDWSTGTVPDETTAQVTIDVPELSTTGHLDFGPIVDIASGEAFTADTVTVAGTVSDAGTAIINTLDIEGELDAPGGVTAGDYGNYQLLGGTLDASLAIDAGNVGGVLEGYGTVNGNIDVALGRGTILATNYYATPGTSTTLTVNGSVDNGGYIKIDNTQTASSPLTLVIDGDVTGTGGSIDLGFGARDMIDVAGSVASGQAILFEGSGSTLLLQDPIGFAADIITFDDFDSGSGNGNAIELAGERASSLTATFVDDPNASADNDSGTLVITDGDTTIADIRFGDDYTTSSFMLTQDGNDTLITLVCYAPGTLIATPAGDRPIEQLSPGDFVSLADGGARPVRWVGRRRVDCRHQPEPEIVLPVRVRRGAFGPGLPRRDLVLSPQHAVYADGFLFPVLNLVNGTSIVQEAVDFQVYLHVELDEHAILLAEGLPAESYLDTGNRSMFANAALSTPREIPSDPCAPMICDGPHLDTLRARLLARSSAAAA